MSRHGRISFVVLLLTVALAAQVNPKQLYLSEQESSNSVPGPLFSGDVTQAIFDQCSDVVITNDRAEADNVLEAGYDWCCTPKGEPRGYRFSLLNQDGDTVYATQTQTLHKAIMGVCNAMNPAKHTNKPKK